MSTHHVAGRHRLTRMLCGFHSSTLHRGAVQGPQMHAALHIALKETRSLRLWPHSGSRSNCSNHHAMQDPQMHAVLHIALKEDRPLRLRPHGAPIAGMGLQLLRKLPDLRLPALVVAAAERSGNGGAALVAASVAAVRCASSFW